MPKKLTIDFETRSAADLKKWGAAAYAEHSSTEVICLALKWEGEEPVIWYSPSFRTARQVSDAYVIKAVAGADVIEAHNAQFEYFIWKYVMSRYGFAMFDSKKLRCSAAKAAMFGLPRSLEQACEVSGVREQKDKEGSRLMMSLCKPRKPTKAEMLADPDWPNKLYWRGTPEDFIRLGKYCMQDTRAEEAFSKHLPELPESEQEVWQFDLAVNDRGVRVDAEAASAIRDMTTRHSALLIREFSQMTGLNSPRQRDATLKHLIALGAEMEGLTAKDVEEELKTSENDTVRRILEVRQSLSKSSTAKYEAFLNARCSDDRLRGMLMYHGAGTGRWTGKLVQPHNFPRGEFSDVDEAISMFESGDMDSLVLFYGDPMIAAATCIRGMIVPGEGKEFVCADYNAIEGRVLAWLAGEETALDVYRNNRDPYRVAASAIYHKAYEDIPKKSHERQIGKTAELACIAEGQLVLTDQGLVKIEEVSQDHKLWDGRYWVCHGGVVCKGIREVIEYDGLIATPDHEVYVEGKCLPIHFGDAASSMARLVQSGFDWEKIRLGDYHLCGEKMASELERLLRFDQMRWMWPRIVDFIEFAYSGEIKGVPELLAAVEGSFVADEKAVGGEGQMSKSEESWVSELRREGDYIRLSIRVGCGAMDSQEFTFMFQVNGDRSHRQLERVCSGKSPVCGSPDKLCKPEEKHSAGMESKRVALLPGCGSETAESRNVQRGYNYASEAGRSGETQELAGYPRKVRVYDIINAGNLHRFTVSGKLVHNCGYQGSVGAFNAMAKNLGVELPEDEVRDIVEKWRASRPATVRYWKELEKACRCAIEEPSKVWSYRNVKFAKRGRFLALKLPSGRCLWYANPRIEFKDMTWGEKKSVVAFDGVDSKTRKWGIQYLYGGLLAENITQAVARDILVNGMLNAEKASYPIVLHVHDEAAAEVPEGFGSVEEFEKLLCRAPAWAEGLPLKAEGWRGRRYRK